MPGMPMLRAHAVRWVSDEPQPGLIAVVFRDAERDEREFVDKTAIFDSKPISRSSVFPISVKVACAIVENRGDTMLITTDGPHGIADNRGRTQFLVRREVDD
jgi:hypothetical protein